MGIVSTIVLIGCQPKPELDAADYRAMLSELSEDVIATTHPLAQVMAQGQTPTTELLVQTQSRLTSVQEEMDALGAPPDELEAAHQYLTEAILQFQQAYDHLINNLNNGAALLFDQEFLTLAAHGGEAVHQAAIAIDPNQ